MIYASYKYLPEKMFQLQYFYINKHEKSSRSWGALYNKYHLYLGKT